MANLSITATCNRSCEYCFAMDMLDEMSVEIKSMPMNIYLQALDFLSRSGIEEVRFLGGEPTTHPHFIQMLDIALDRGFKVLIFSGGLIPNKVLEKLTLIPDEQLSLLINVIPPWEKGASAKKRQKEVFEKLGQKIILGLNIDSPSVTYDFLLDWILAYNLLPKIRLGLAHPTLEGSNDSLHPRHYPEVGKRVSNFGLKAKQYLSLIHI